MALQAALARSVAHYEMQSDSLLAKAPAMAKRSWYANDNSAQQKRWEELRLQLEARLYGLRNWRLSWWEHWAKLAEAILPRRYHWLIVPNTMTRGSAINQAIKDPTGTQAVRVCTAGMRSGIMSSSRPWFKLKPGLRNFKPDQAAKDWFEDTQDRMYRVFAGSNYYQSGTTMFEDLTVFGTGPKLMYEDRQNIIRCQNPCAGEYYLALGSDGRVNAFYRTFVQTVAQLVMMFGLENCSDNVQTLWELKGAALETEIVVAHALEPNFSLAMPGMTDPNLGVVPGNFTYREYYWEWGVQSNRPLSVKGFRTKPFIAPPWTRVSNDPYGRSPGMDALPDILQLHLMTVRQAEAIDKLVRPPLLADSSLKNQPSSILPGRVTYVNDPAKGMKPIFEIRMDIDHMSKLIEKIEKRIDKWFFNDLFLMMENIPGVQPRNEMDIAERRGEKMQVLGPVVEGITNELADDIRRAYSIVSRRGLIAPKPQSLQNVPLDIDFESMVTVAQRAAETASMERGMTVITNMDKAYPDAHVGDVINKEKWARSYLERANFPASVMNGEDEVQQIRNGRQAAQAQAAKQAQTAQMLTHTAPAMAGAAKTASEIDPGGALNALQIAQGLTPANPTSVPAG
ncbi:portal protein [Bradyrhizobium sp. PMVTL-01]|uniref:portal protein n=1 Tax=Bradyrhizobium sp. PMVTL-01 TaxID=3434999 RepID=UPI003F6F4DD1